MVTIPVSSLLPLIPLFPLIAYALIALGSKLWKNFSAFISITAILISAFLSILAFLQKIQAPEQHFSVVYPFLQIGNQNYQIGLYLDNLSAVMLIVVTVVGACIHIYSVGYMHGEEGFPRYFGLLSLFSSAMIGLVLADNYFLLYTCWELVGVTSYALIGFYFRRPSAAKAGKKAFLTTRTGDIGFLVGWLILFSLTGNITITGSKILVLQQGGNFLLMLSALLIFWGAIGKSAQFPLHVWLPDAMEGPTPVSALIHAATMVAAGVYLVARMFFLFEANPTALLVVAYVGSFTAFFASTIGMAMNDIKRVLAYSTISQLGYMMAGIGTGNWAGAIFHLFTHAFFKALLFLGSGSVIHATHTNDMRKMGGLAQYMPITHWTFLAGTLALVGIPPFSGFFSKESILLSAFHYALETGHWLPFLFLIFGVFFTSFYMFRLMYLTFWMPPRWNHPPHESPPVMTIPLIFLALGSLSVGWLPFAFTHFLNPLEAEEKFHISLPLVLALIFAFLGFLLAYQVYYLRKWSPYLLRKRLPLLESALVHKYYFDEIYDFSFASPGLTLSHICNLFDKWCIDSIGNLAGYLTVGFSFLSGAIDKYVVDGIVNATAYISGLVGNGIRKLQSGFVSDYLLVITESTAFLLFFIWFLFGGQNVLLNFWKTLLGK
ncbi:MAG: NADH-quinone oxidoreductase subunit L [bacterium JZ-2024 1]